MNLVVGMATNYTAADLRNFILSFKRHQSGAILLFLKGNDADTRDWLRQQGVMTVDTALELDPDLARHFAMKELVPLYPEVTRFFHCDVRDAVAQGDIFAQLPEPGLHVFQEDATVSLGGNKAQTAWIASAYDKRTADQYRDGSVICAGTTLGDRESFMIYLDSMTRECRHCLERENPPDVTTKIWDQAFHLHLVYSGLLKRKLEAAGKRLHCHENGIGVFTVARAQEISVNKAFQVVRPGMAVPAVVHQYDRFEFLQEMVDTLHAGD